MSKALRRSERVVVVPYRPKFKIVMAMLLLVLVALSCVAGFLYTAYRLELWRADLLGQRDLLVEQLLQTSAKLETQEAQLATVTMGAEIDRQAADALKEQLVERQKTIAGLNEELSFYRNLMNPTAGQSGLDAYRFLVYGSTASDQLRYRLVLQQLGTAQRLINVDVNARVIGTIDGEPVKLDFANLLVDGGNWVSEVKFRYYYDLEGRFRLPEDFVAEQLEVVLTQARKAPTTHIFDWKILE